MKTIPATKLGSIEEVDKSLLQLAQIESTLAKKEASMNLKLQKVKDQFDDETATERAAKLATSQEIEGFLILNKNMFNHQRTKKLTHGTIGFRFGTPKVLTLSRKFNTKTILEHAKRLFKAKYVRSKEELNKDSILTDYSTDAITDDKLAAIGLRVDKGEKFVVEIDWESIENN